MAEKHRMAAKTTSHRFKSHSGFVQPSAASAASSISNPGFASFAGASKDSAKTLARSNHSESSQ